MVLAFYYVHCHYNYLSWYYCRRNSNYKIDGQVVYKLGLLPWFESLKIYVYIL